ncbi:hypothetical protein HHI36_016505, partial [Cryptolaemus montrouzieri]
EENDDFFQRSLTGKAGKKIETESTLQADALNDYFPTIGQITVSNCKPSIEKALKIMRNVPSKEVLQPASMYIAHTDREELSEIVRNLKAKYTMDICGINTMLLKRVYL